MKVIIAKDYDEMSIRAFEVMRETVESNPKAVLGLATGSSPIGLYKNMIADHQAGGLSYRDVISVNLDEYVGLDQTSDQSYVYFMRKNLFEGLDIRLENTFLPNGTAKDLAAECDRYNALLAKYRQDIQLLGIGSNGHIGFNEPGTSFDSVTHVVDLTENTVKDNARLFASIDDVPRKALSMGISNILNAKKILIIASGANKAKAVYGMVKGKPDPSCPASSLQLHSDVVVVCDKEAAALL